MKPSVFSGRMKIIGALWRTEFNFQLNWDMLRNSHSLGLFRCEISTEKWERCNEIIQKLCHCPVMGLKENTMYQFRVCAVNQAGVGRPSKLSNPIVTSDPMEPSRTMGNFLILI